GIKAESGGSLHVQDRFLRALVSRTVLYRHEVALAAHPEAAYAGASGGRDRAVDGAAVEAGDRPDDSHAAYAGDHLSGVRRGDELLLLRALASHALDYAQGPPARQRPRPRPGEVDPAELAWGGIQTVG